MTPHPTSHRGRHGTGSVVRRAAALVGAVLVLGGTPLVARALTTDSTPSSDPAATSAANIEWALPVSVFELDTQIAASDADPSATAPRVDIAPPVAADPEPASATGATVDPVVAALADTYTWDEFSARVAVLQGSIGVQPDGKYGAATRQAHLFALAFVGLPADHVPAVPPPPLPPGPSADQWAALRQCESGGNYAITNPSGKYRGAYQFDRPTWNSVAGRHAPHLVGVDPAAAAPGEQDAMAYALYSERGARPWPQCGRHL